LGVTKASVRANWEYHIERTTAQETLIMGDDKKMRKWDVRLLLAAFSTKDRSKLAKTVWVSFFQESH
jgi:hypothetical protein